MLQFSIDDGDCYREIAVDEIGKIELAAVLLVRASDSAFLKA